MAEPISIQQLKDASEDAISLADFINKPENVMIPRRLASDINSLQYYLDYMKSYAQRSYETYDEMVSNASNLSENVSVFVTNDSDTFKNGIYTYNGTSFVKGEYQPENLAKDFVEAKLDALPFEGGVLSDTFVVVDGSLSQRTINKGLESIADLSTIENPKDGLRVYVKSYHAGLGKGGGYFTYDSSNSLEFDGVFTFFGWEREVLGSTYTPYMAGCICDGITDDAQNLDKLHYQLQLRKLQGTVVFDRDILINSIIPLTGNLEVIPDKVNYPDLMIGVRLVTGVTLHINSGVKILIGSAFDDKPTHVFCASSHKTLDDWYGFESRQSNIRITGGGTIDSTNAGGMNSKHLLSRFLIYIASTENFKIDNIKFIGGDYSNIVVTRGKSRGLRVYDCIFENTLLVSTYSRDYSAIYSQGADTRIYNNIFKEDSVKGLVGCAFEGHGNNEYFYNNKITGLNSAVILAAYLSDDLQPTKTDVHVFNNISRCVYFCRIWHDPKGRRPYDSNSIYNNTHYSVRHYNRQEQIDLGIKPEIVDLGIDYSRSLRSFIEIISDDSSIDYKTGVINAFHVYGNKFYADGDIELREFFIRFEANLNSGLHVYDNYIKSPRLFSYTKSLVDGAPAPKINNFVWKNNYVDYSLVKSGVLVSELDCYSINNSHIEVHINNTYPSNIDEFVPHFFNTADWANSKNNTFIYTCEQQPNIEATTWGLHAKRSRAFYENNYVVTDAQVALGVIPLIDDPTKAFFTVDEGAVYCTMVQVLAYDQSVVNPFLMPTYLHRTPSLDDNLPASRDGWRYFALSNDYTQLNISTSTISTKVFARYYS